MRLSYLLAALSVCCLAVRSAAQSAPVGSDAIYDGFSQPYDVALDSSNNLYIADHNLQLVLKVASSGGTPLVYYNVTGTTTAIAYPDGLCLGPNNPPDVYVVDGNNQRVIKFNNAGQVQSIIAASAATPAFNYPWNCAVDPNNNLFVSNTVGQGINVFNAAGTQTNFFNNTTPAFKYPNQIALDSAGANLYVADSNNFHIVKLNAQTGAQVQLFNLPSGSYPNGVAVDSQNNVYATDTVNGRLVAFNSAGATLWNATATNPGLNQPRGIAVDSSFNVYVADSGNFRIFKFYSSSSGYTGGFGGGFTGTTPTVNGYKVVSISAGLSAPYDVVLDGSNNLYVADNGNNRVVKLQAGTSGTVQQVYSTSNPSLLQPDGLCLDSSSNLYIVDSGNNRLVQVSNSNSQLQSFVNTSYTPVLAFPWNCAVDSAGNIYVSNTNGNGVQKLSSTGTQLGFFTTTSPALSYPNQLALDSAGSVYVADSNGYRVVKMNGTTGAQLQVFSLPTGSFPNGVAIDSSNNVWVTETVQGQVWQFSSSGTLLQQLALPVNVEPLNNPRGLFVDKSGNVYVADAGNNRIVVFQANNGNGNGASAVQLSSGLLVAAAAVAAALALLF